MNYTNIRTKSVHENWPYGRKVKTLCIFSVVSNNRGERIEKLTKNPRSGAMNKPKYSTYNRISRICTGDDGKLYLMHLSEYGQISIESSDMKHSHESIFREDPRYKHYYELLTSS